MLIKKIYDKYKYGLVVRYLLDKMSYLGVDIDIYDLCKEHVVSREDIANDNNKYDIGYLDAHDIKSVQ